MKNKRHYAVIPAAGVGSRMKASLPKQYLRIHGKSILEHTIDKLLSHPKIESVVVALSSGDPYFSTLPVSGDSRVIRVDGGKERADSVLSALNYLCKNVENSEDWVLVHDAARPCVAIEDINKLIKNVSEHPVGGILAAPVRDTMKLSNPEQEISATVDRNNLWHALTPQMFRIKELKEALEKALNENVVITDEASAMESLGFSPKLIAGRTDNLKITQPEDLALAEFYLSREIHT